MVTSFALPHWESRMGVGSSMREIAWQLRHRHAAIAYVDRYAAGMEFYFGEAVFYVIDRMPRQISCDTGNCEALGELQFLTPAELSDHL